MGPAQIGLLLVTALEQASNLGQLLKRLHAEGGRDATAEEVEAAIGTRKAAEERVDKA